MSRRPIYTSGSMPGTVEEGPDSLSSWRVIQILTERGYRMLTPSVYRNLDHIRIYTFAPYYGSVKGRTVSFRLNHHDRADRAYHFQNFRLFIFHDKGVPDRLLFCPDVTPEGGVHAQVHVDLQLLSQFVDVSYFTTNPLENPNDQLAETSSP